MLISPATQINNYVIVHLIPTIETYKSVLRMVLLAHTVPFKISPDKSIQVSVS